MKTSLNFHLFTAEDYMSFGGTEPLPGGTTTLIAETVNETWGTLIILGGHRDYGVIVTALFTPLGSDGTDVQEYRWTGPGHRGFPESPEEAQATGWLPLI